MEVKMKIAKPSKNILKTYKNAKQLKKNLFRNDCPLRVIFRP